MRRRLGGDVEGDQRLTEVANNLRQAAKEMEAAPEPLRKEAGRDALPPEQRALQRLLAADAIFREVQVAFGNQSNGGGGGGGEQQQSSLVCSSWNSTDEEPVRDRSESTTPATEQEKSEAERRLEELARRQERAIEEQRRRMQQSANGGGSSNQRGWLGLIDGNPSCSP